MWLQSADLSSRPISPTRSSWCPIISSIIEKDYQFSRAVIGRLMSHFRNKCFGMVANNLLIESDIPVDILLKRALQASSCWCRPDPRACNSWQRRTGGSTPRQQFIVFKRHQTQVARSCHWYPSMNAFESANWTPCSLGFTEMDSSNSRTHLLVKAEWQKQCNRQALQTLRDSRCK